MSYRIIAIVPAAGVGERARPATVQGAAVVPKQYQLLKGQPMLRWSVQALLAEARISQVRVAVAPHDTWADSALQGLDRTVCRPCGGPTRADTVLAALRDADLGPSDWVLVHDAARPGLPAAALARLVDQCLAAQTGGLLAVPGADTVKQAEPACQGLPAAGRPVAMAKQANEAWQVARTVSRDTLWLAQTPQMFQAGPLVAALQQALQSGAPITDEASAIEYAGGAPLLVSGSARNFKVTWPDDFELMEKWL